MTGEYFAPTRLDEALDVLATRDAVVVAGGTDYYPALGTRAERRDLVDLSRIAGLRGIERLADGSLRIGAATTWSDVARAALPPACAGLQAAARGVGSVQIQNSATLAGNLCNASPAADGVPPLLTLDAAVEIAGRSGRRHLALQDFILGPRRTALRPGEVVVAIRLPAPPAGAVSAFHKLGARRYLVISIAMTAVVLSLGPDGRIAALRVAVGACSPVARRLGALEAEAVGRYADTLAVTPAHLAPLSPIDDVRADAAYRHEAVAEQVQRAVRAAAAVAAAAGAGAGAGDG
ncbi:MAG: FAD binding domain-containing protein [Pseudomonadota bacterium]